MKNNDEKVLAFLDAKEKFRDRLINATNFYSKWLLNYEDKSKKVYNNAYNILRSLKELICNLQIDYEAFLKEYKELM